MWANLLMGEETVTSRSTLREPLSVLWRSLASPWTLMGLLGLVALVLILSTLIPQIPLQAVDDPQAWLAVQPGVFGRGNGLIRALGLFDIYHSLWFHLLLAVTALALFVWFVQSLELAWQTARRKDWGPAAFAFWGSNPPQVQVSSSLEQDDTLVRLRAFLVRDGYRCMDVSGLQDPNLVAGRREWLLWARPLFFGSFLVALAALAVVRNWGWQNEDWQPSPGESQAIGHGVPYVLHLDRFVWQQDQDGLLCDYYSEISWLKDDATVRQDVAGVGQPARLQGIAVRQVGFAPAVKLSGQDQADRPLVFQTGGGELAAPGEFDVSFATPEIQQLVLIAGHDLFLSLSFTPQDAEGRPTLYVAIVDNGGSEQRPVAVLHESGGVAVGDLHVRVDLEYCPILRVDYRPGMGLVLASAVLAVLALLVGWIAGPLLIWIAVGPDAEDSISVQILSLPGTRGDLRVPELASRLGKVLADDA
jgi:hypothetical protein